MDKVVHVDFEETEIKLLGTGRTIEAPQFWPLNYATGADRLAKLMLSDETPKTPERARELLDKFFESCPSVKEWVEAHRKEKNKVLRSYGENTRPL